MARGADFLALIAESRPWFMDERLADAPDGCLPESDAFPVRAIRQQLTGTLELTRLAGSLDSRYAGLTWGEALHSTLTQSCLDRLVENPEAFLGSGPKPISVVSHACGLRWWIAHGTPDAVVTRFLYHAMSQQPFLYGISTEIRTPDSELTEKLHALRDRGYTFKQNQRVLVSVRRGRGWSDSIFDTNYCIREPNGKERVLNRTGILSNAYPAKKPFWRIW